MKQGHESEEPAVWVVDETGAEIPGTRRAAAIFENGSHLERAINALLPRLGDGCTVVDNVLDWASYWRSRREGQ